MTSDSIIAYIRLNCDLIYFKTEEEWHKLRKEGIGGSDVGAIMGLNQYQTPLDIYKSKKETIPFITNKAIEFGKETEDAMFTIFKEKYKERFDCFLFKNIMFRNKKHKFLQASVDGIVYDKLLKKYGVLEIKSAQDRDDKWYKNGNIDIPISYEKQGEHYLNVLEFDFVIYFTIINYNYDNGKDMSCKILQPRIIYKEDLDLEYCKKYCIEFWKNNVIKNIPPKLVFKF